MANGDFLQAFDGCIVENIITTSSDHYAVLIKIARGGDLNARQPLQDSFKFEVAWMRAPDYDVMVEEGWKAHSGGPASISNTWKAIKVLSSTLK